MAPKRSRRAAFLLLCVGCMMPRLTFIPFGKVERPVSAGAALWAAALSSPAYAQIQAQRPEGLPDFLQPPEKEAEYASLWKSWGSQPKQVGPADPSLTGLSGDDRTAILGVLVVSIFVIPVFVMSAFGAALKVPWARPEKEPGREKKLEIDWSDLKDM
eukprot:CAMPEP_0181411530 /NCGR_PEP_ID=MMETSP1110-20121109/7927_1 /TAXON_ID=174948 /ORGANISM="Symbiodinium sp., Strain CCMP421" /LENGTH=157 /DNA_ID=CAMNT_0023534161 /DNA_START=62 /DNA_END=535 /DNA_ORIENTATION=-